MNSKLSDLLAQIEKGDVKSSCIFELVDTYYQCVIGSIDERDDNGSCVETPFPEELLLPVEKRNSGIGDALIKLINAGHRVDDADGDFNALMLAVGSGDAPMVHFLIGHGADANSWPDKDLDSLPDEENYYLDDIDANFFGESISNDKDIEYMNALYHTALVLVEDAHLGPYSGLCLSIDENRHVSLTPPKTKY